MHTVDKPIAEKNKAEIEQRLNGMGDYVRMSYLQRAMRSGLDFDTKKFVMVKLAGIYEVRGMHLDAAKMIKAAAEINTTYKDKIRDFMKAVELYIKGNDYTEADRVFAQALVLGNTQEKAVMKQNLKDYYINQAKLYIQHDRRNYARQAYEKALTLDLDIGERREIQKELLSLYDRLGLVREYYSLKESMATH